MKKGNGGTDVDGFLAEWSESWTDKVHSESNINVETKPGIANSGKWNYTRCRPSSTSGIGKNRTLSGSVYCNRKHLSYLFNTRNMQPQSSANFGALKRGGVLKGDSGTNKNKLLSRFIFSYIRKSMSIVVTNHIMLLYLKHVHSYNNQPHNASKPGICLVFLQSIISICSGLMSSRWRQTDAVFLVDWRGSNRVTGFQVWFH